MLNLLLHSFLYAFEYITPQLPRGRHLFVSLLSLADQDYKGLRDNSFLVGFDYKWLITIGYVEVAW